MHNQVVFKAYTKTIMFYDVRYGSYDVRYS